MTEEGYWISVEGRMCHPETCCCSSHGIYVIRFGTLFVERFETEKEAKQKLSLLKGEQI